MIFDKEGNPQTLKSLLEGWLGSAPDRAKAEVELLAYTQRHPEQLRELANSEASEPELYSLIGVLLSSINEVESYLKQDAWLRRLCEIVFIGWEAENDLLESGMEGIRTNSRAFAHMLEVGWKSSIEGPGEVPASNEVVARWIDEQVCSHAECLDLSDEITRHFLLAVLENGLRPNTMPEQLFSFLWESPHVANEDWMDKFDIAQRVYEAKIKPADELLERKIWAFDTFFYVTQFLSLEQRWRLYVRYSMMFEGRNSLLPVVELPSFIKFAMHAELSIPLVRLALGDLEDREVLWSVLRQNEEVKEPLILPTVKKMLVEGDIGQLNEIGSVLYHQLGEEVGVTLANTASLEVREIVAEGWNPEHERLGDVLWGSNDLKIREKLVRAWTTAHKDPLEVVDRSAQIQRWFNDSGERGRRIISDTIYSGRSVDYTRFGSGFRKLPHEVFLSVVERSTSARIPDLQSLLKLVNSDFLSSEQAKILLSLGIPEVSREAKTWKRVYPELRDL